MMTTEQRRLVKVSYDSLRDIAGPVALLFYGRLFESDPNTRPLFHNDLAVQGRKLMDTLDLLVRSLDEFEGLRAHLSELGRRHAAYGVGPQHYESVTAALLWAIGQALGPDFDDATRAAWRELLAAVGGAMREGAASTPETR